jgi:hypothetical protein
MKATFVASATLAGIATDCQEYYITEDVRALPTHL